MSEQWFSGREMIRELSEDAIADCSAPGDVEENVKFWIKELEFSVPDESRDFAREYIVSTGGWSREEVAEMDDAGINTIIFWFAACDAKEGEPLLYLDS